MPPFQLLELNVISAQDLAPVGRNMRTYAVSWVHPDRKLSTRVDTEGHTNPTWNDKFVFRVDDEFLCSDTSAIMIEIYALHWFKDIHVGTVRVLIGNLAPPPSRPHTNRTPLGTRFVALQVRRPSGRPQGILNIGFTVLDGSMHSMPLYTHNASAVGYRHLMGEKDAYDSHNHLSPHVLVAASATPRAELRRAKSDTSSVVAAEAVARQHRVVANHNRAHSNISGNEVNVESMEKDNVKKGKKKKKSRSNSSVVSSVNEETTSVLSEPVSPWKIKSGKASPHDDDILHVEQLSPLHHYHNDVAYDDIHNHPHDHDAHSDVDSVSDESISEHNFVTDAREEQHVPVNNVTYEVRATPKHHFTNSPAPHYINSPAPQFRNSPAPQFKNSPAPQFKNSPKPQYINSPAPQYKNSPLPHYMSSPAPQYKNSPAPHYMSSPAPQFKNSPAKQFKNSPAKQFKNSPAPQFMNSPAKQFKNSPAPQFMNSPAPQFKNLANPQYMGSPKPQFRNSPAVAAPQFRASPVVSKFHPSRGTPMHTFGKVNGGLEYMTPRRSNLANMGGMMMTESELGPSPSEVAAAIARNPVIDEGESVGGWSLDESVEGLQSKLERWRSDLPPVIDRGELSSHPTSSTKTSRHSRRHTDGGSTPGGGGVRAGGGRGLFSCFSKICGVECYIGCGDPKKKDRRRRAASMDDNTSSLL